jgi:Holliday junction resolvase
LDWLKSQGYWAVKVGLSNRNGCPDILASIDGCFVGIEVKNTGKIKNVSVLQRYQINEINNTGGLAFVTDSLPDCQIKIKTIKDGIINGSNMPTVQS